MKRYLITLFALLAVLTGCERFDADDHKFGNVVYLNVSQTSPVQLATFSNNRATYDCTLQAALTYPAGQDVQVSLAVDPPPVADYNAQGLTATIGGGGLGKIAINYGYNKYNYAVMLIAVVLIVILVQIFQSLGTWISIRSDHRLTGKGGRSRRKKELSSRIDREKKTPGVM